jgi:hypothetical protein
VAFVHKDHRILPDEFVFFAQKSTGGAGALLSAGSVADLPLGAPHKVWAAGGKWPLPVPSNIQELLRTGAAGLCRDAQYLRAALPRIAMRKTGRAVGRIEPRMCLPAVRDVLRADSRLETCAAHHGSRMAVPAPVQLSAIAGIVHRAGALVLRQRMEATVTGEPGGWMWLAIDVAAVAILAAALAYGITAWRRRRQTASDRTREEATDRLYRQPDPDDPSATRRRVSQ